MGARQTKQVKGNKQLTSGADVPGTTIDVMPAPVIRAWYRQPDESPTAYSYFKLYLQQEPPRNIHRFAKFLRTSAANLRGSYVYKHKWADRAALYDDYYSQIQLDRERARRERKDLEWLARRDEQRQQEWDIAQALLEKVREMLGVPLFQETVNETLKGLDPDGRIIIEQVITFKPLDWSAIDMARFFEVASKMARLATGMDTDQKRLRIDVGALTDDELERIANQT